MKKLLLFLFTAMLTLGLVASANALTIQGEVWMGITDGDDVVKTFDWENTLSTATFVIEGEFNLDSRGGDLTGGSYTYND